MSEATTVFVIPDTQVRPGVPTDHMTWIGKYIAEKARGRTGPVHVVHLGDHWDFPSLSSYDRKGGTLMEGRRFSEDLKAGDDAWRLLSIPLERMRDKRQAETQLWALGGNHEDRADRAAKNDAALEGTVGSHLCDRREWTVVPFLQPLVIGGVAFVHYVYNPMTGKPWGGMIETRIKNVGQSFVMGHQQQFKYGQVPVLGGRRIGVIAGNCYLHNEDYIGPQGNNEWRGILVLHQVENGEFDLMQVSLDFLCRKYEGKPLKEFCPTLGSGR